MKLIYLLLLTMNYSFANEGCELETYDKVIKINKRLDDQIIKKSNCSQEINNSFIELIEASSGKLSARQMILYLGEEHKTQVKVSPKTITVQSITESIEEYINNPSIKVGKVTSLYGKSSYNLRGKDQLIYSCDQCQTIGERNIKVSNGNLQSWLTVRLGKTVEVLTTNRSLSHYDSLLTKNDFSKTHIIDFQGKNYFSDIETIKFYKVNRNLKKGEMIQLQHLYPKNLITRGQKVNLKISKGTIQLNAVGIAKSNGKFGDYIEFENSKTKKKFLGKVIDFNKAIIEL